MLGIWGWRLNSISWARESFWERTSIPKFSKDGAKESLRGSASTIMV